MTRDQIQVLIDKAGQGATEEQKLQSLAAQTGIAEQKLQTFLEYGFTPDLKHPDADEDAIRELAAEHGIMETNEGAGDAVWD